MNLVNKSFLENIVDTDTWPDIFTQTELEKIYNYISNCVDEGKRKVVLRVLWEEDSGWILFPFYVWIEIAVGERAPTVSVFWPDSYDALLGTPSSLEDDGYLCLEERAFV